MAKDYIFFWKPDQKWGMFSQWYYSPFKLGPYTFPTAEHYIMWSKALLFRDQKVADMILAESSPAAVRKLGQQVKRFKQNVWDEEAPRIVWEGNMLKFLQNEDIRIKFNQIKLGTKFAEASPDKIWGIGCEKNDAWINFGRWGQNRLGQVLERVHEDLSLLQIFDCDCGSQYELLYGVDHLESILADCRRAIKTLVNEE